MSDSRAANFLKAIGYTNRFTSGISRSSNGDRVFIEFEDHGTSKVAVVSCTGVVVKELPGHCRIDDTETPVFWTSWTNGSHTPISFRVAGALPKNISTCGWVSDANFVALFEQGNDHWWIAKVQTPLEKLVTFDWKHEAELIASQDAKLYVFVKGQPESKPRKDKWAILKRYEYDIAEGKVRLISVQDFDYSWYVMDFDPRTGLALLSSWDDMFAHGILVDTAAGKRADLPRADGHCYFVDECVVKKIREILHLHILR